MFFKSLCLSLSMLSLLLGTTVQGAVESTKKVLTFTAIPDQDQSQLRLRFQKVADYLASELNITVKYIPVKSYAAAITAFRNNQVQLAWCGGLSGVRARQLVPGSQGIAQGVEDREFSSYFIAHRSAGLTPTANFPQGIVNKTFTFGSKGSTSGRLMPEFYIRQHLQASPQQLFKAVGFSGDHSLTITQVQAGAFQVGVVNYQVWESMLAAGKIDTDKVQVIWQTPHYTDYQWTIRAGVDSDFGAGFSERVQAVLLAITAPDILAQFPRSGFIKASNADYLAIETTALQLDLIQP